MAPDEGCARNAGDIRRRLKGADSNGVRISWTAALVVANVNIVVASGECLSSEHTYADVAVVADVVEQSIGADRRIVAANVIIERCIADGRV